MLLNIDDYRRAARRTLRKQGLIIQEAKPDLVRYLRKRSRDVWREMAGKVFDASWLKRVGAARDAIRARVTEILSAPNVGPEATKLFNDAKAMLARIVKGECPANMSFEGKVSVAAVLLNRVRYRAATS